MSEKIFKEEKSEELQLQSLCQKLSSGNIEKVFDEVIELLKSPTSEGIKYEYAALLSICIVMRPTLQAKMDSFVNSNTTIYG